ncbi:Bug family tripartite tricarboxylate transporter substrate binding protein [Belnapia moabensis]|uniref:Bug family tripartite tricarboxylate transporter substrate binding protein n=1 Tax=Belnapia moabensis TaxID=365533 RepID=UPI000693E056|nr:tripartite tricarboxylate transporter substrate binding protein [Belnapia moabensis]
MTVFRDGHCPTTLIPGRRTLIAAGIAAALAGRIPVSAQAAEPDFPSRPLRLIAPFPPAGAADVISRLLAEPLGRALGQTVLVENRSGGGGRIGTEAAVRSPADGYTLLMGSQATNSINPELYSDLNYDPAKDLAPIAMVGGVGSVLYVRNSLDVISFQQLLERARQKPGELTYGSAGNGGGSHLAMALLELMAKVRMSHAPYRGTAPATADVLAGRIDMVCDPFTTGMPQVASGRVRALAVTTPQRYPGLPDVPTMAEAGVPGYEAVSYYGLFTPVGVPDWVLKKLRDTAARVIADPGVSAKLAEQGMVNLGLGPEEFAEYVAKDRKRWGEVIREAKITVG